MHQVLNEKIPYFSDDGLSCAESTLRYLIEHGYADLPRSEERRVGKECRSRWSPYH